MNNKCWRKTKIEAEEEIEKKKKAAAAKAKGKEGNKGSCKDKKDYRRRDDSRYVNTNEVENEFVHSGKRQEPVTRADEWATSG